MKRPIGIAIISILNFLSGIFLILVGLGFAGGGSYGFFAGKDLSTDQKEGMLGLGVAGVVALVVGIITLIVAIALWRLKTWAWYLAFLLTLFSFAQWLYTGYKSGFSKEVIIYSVAYGLLTLYFLSVKKHFGPSAS